MNRPVILANGTFPEHEVPRAALRAAAPLVCCDGAADKLIRAGMTPEVIIGDLDSIMPEHRYRFSGIMVEDRDQETNDLTKAVHWCRDRGFGSVTILGATGEREDHTIANISLLAHYSRFIRADMITNSGTLRVVHETAVMASFPGQQISLFCFTPAVAIASEGLKYPLGGRCLEELWQGSLNEALGDSFRLSLAGGTLIVYCLHRGVA